jgi:hypothetical protein
MSLLTDQFHLDFANIGLICTDFKNSFIFDLKKFAMFSLH